MRSPILQPLGTDAESVHARARQDAKTKMLLGTAIVEAAKKCPDILVLLAEATSELGANDRDFLTRDSMLWFELHRLHSATHPAVEDGPKPCFKFTRGLSHETRQEAP